jgi:hypothetical protein
LVNGFRSWTDVRPPPGFKRCRCGWSGLPHYSLSPSYRCEPAATIAGFEAADRKAAKRMGVAWG